MRRLLIVTTVPVTINAFLLPFARHFREQGWRVDAMTRRDFGFSECAEEFDRVWEVEWSRNPLDPRNLLRAPHRIQEIVDREGYDIVHVHTPVASFVTRFALRGLRRTGTLKMIYTAHGFHFYQGAPPIRNGIFISLEKLAGRWTDYLVVINHEDEKAADRYGIVLPDRLVYMPGIGLDTEYYNPETILESAVAHVREEMGIGPSDMLFLMVAEFIPRKHHRDVLSAFSLLGRPGIHLALAGRGPLLEPMRELAADLEITHRVHFLGFRKDIPTLIRASVATLLPSEQEGLPRSVMESLSLAVPVIGADIRGMRDLLMDGSGLLFELGDVEGLADAMVWVLDNPEEARAMGWQGREQIVTSYSLRQIIALHDELYNRALEG